MKIEINHALDRAEAKSRIIGLIARLKKEYGEQIQQLDEQWGDHTGKIKGTAKGHSVSGTVDVEEKVVGIDLKIPFLLKVFSGKIRSVIEEHVGKALK